MGIEFVSWKTPVKEHLQALAAFLWFYEMISGVPTSMILTIYLVFFTNYWFTTLVYLSWIWFFDRFTCEKGGKCYQWMRSITWFRYIRDYFSHTLEKVPDCQLDPKRNYFFCCFPHGIFSAGTFLSFATDCSGVRKLFPDHFPHLLTLRIQFLAPFHREYIHSLGGCAPSTSSINHLLQQPAGGKIVALVVGGAAEALYARPGETRLFLKTRKGFVKIALKNGSPLVPVYTFGENEVYNQLDNSEGTLLRKFQESMKRWTGITPVTPIGRGIFQKTFGLVPHRTPLNTVVGEPIEVEKIENPTQEDIDKYHQKFVQGLERLFDTYKHKYMKNSKNVKLNIV